MFRRPQSPSPQRSRRQSEGGYILLTFLLIIAILAIFAAAAERSLTQQIKRDREEELIHRGVQYSRAVRHYYKKFGKYPTRIEDLQSTNTIRFLRKRYKDPITGKDFKLLHQGEVQMSFAGGLGGAGGLQGGGAALQALAAQAGMTGQNGQNSQALAAGMAAAAAATQPAGPVNINPTDADSADQDPNAKASGSTGGPGTSPGSPIGTGPTFGGGAIVGVVSTSKLESIRAFNRKDHYNQWQFIYDPTSDRGGLLMTPNQPPLNINNNNNGQPGQPGTGQPGMGQPGSGINGGSGFGNQPTSPGNPPPQQSAQPDTPQQ